MEASVRIFSNSKTNLKHHFFSHSSFLHPKHSFLKFPTPIHSPRITLLKTSPTHYSPLTFLLSLSTTHFKGLDSDPKETFFSWNQAPVTVNNGNVAVFKEKKSVLAVVMLGWLGAEEKHLKRYIELYADKGIHAVSFIVPVKDVWGFDLGKKVERRIEALSEELVRWLSEKEDDGRERGLLFHTFSNTGWLAYGAILDYLQSRGDFMDKIKGCVIDSGGDPEIDPQVWAAGFSAALLKKCSSATLPSVEAIRHELQTDDGISKLQKTEPHLLETLLLSSLEKFFSFVLKLPDVNRRLTKIISTLSKSQPSCPQLYLYSTADKVIPFGPVEMFMQEQKMIGRKVWAYNFGSSPHVDHYRNFPHVYSAELYRFLKECDTEYVHK